MIWLKIVGRRGQFNFLLLTKFSPLNWRVVDGRGRCYSRVRQKHSCFTLLFDGLCSDSELYLLAPRKSTQSGVQYVRKGQEAGQCLASRFYSLGPKKTSRKMPKRKSDGGPEAQSDVGPDAAENGTTKKPKAEKKDPNADAIAALNVPEKYTTDRKSEEGNESNLKIASWNVAGLRAWIKKDGISYIAKEDPDIFFVMETKCADDAIPEVTKVEGYHTYWHGAAVKKGYSGTGMFTKKEPISVKYGIGIEEHDGEGRVITAEFEDFYFVGCYVPNSSRGLVRLPYRKEWDVAFHEYLVNLDKKKPLIFCGDLNVAHQEIDLKNPKPNRNKTPGFTDDEREGFTKLLDEGFVDCLRHLYPDREFAYSFWTYMGNCRVKNVGWRLDYFVISKRLLPKLCDSDLRTWVPGSDHCPITLDMAM
ncbi:DNA-(apurinic or apyrimidinic site) lyase-like [Asterias rubens]|uniref:DNA-(apurinic or apyrimidinic site) lyase-like n=1 Tax=Asterias rubens TaxID=7604 RepID=UPI0014557589|nr:DNA-(apurinic or apyrimidinic site) lyase-like [Asterias rubens]